MIIPLFEGLDELKDGDIIIDDVVFTLTACDDMPNHIHIERIFTPDDMRRKGKVNSALLKMVDMADSQGVSLSSNIMPDDDDREVTMGLRRAFAAAGFKAVEMDGETYPNDVERQPAIKVKKSRQDNADTFVRMMRNLSVAYTCSIDLHNEATNNVVSIESIEIGNRGVGLGSRFMKMMTKKADEMGITLELSPGPFEVTTGTGEILDGVELVDWYFRNGFVWDDTGSYMVRIPK
jgi:hypothetical protein